MMQGVFSFKPMIWFCFVLFFIQSFLRSLIFDLRDIEGDRIMGRETLVTIIGESRVKAAIRTVLICSIGVLILCPSIFSSMFPRFNGPFIPAAFAAQSAPFFYLLLFMIRNKNNGISRSIFFNVLADAQFYISGLCALFVSTLH
jgi:4-hydroxybenzoate polyprenyltransferase